MSAIGRAGSTSARWTTSRVRGARVVKTPLGCIAVFRTADDEVFALDDRCPHKGGPLSARASCTATR